jgi:uncharacterized RDD family membrane protein YckC
MTSLAESAGDAANANALTYPSVLRRYVATLLDLATIWFCVYGLTRIPDVASSRWGMPLAAAAVILLYEPLFTSRLCTLGQALMGFRVKDFRSKKRISVGMAYFRTLVKYSLGAVSVLTIPARADRRAIHDLAVDSIVLERHAR